MRVGLAGVTRMLGLGCAIAFAVVLVAVCGARAEAAGPLPDVDSSANGSVGGGGFAQVLEPSQMRFPQDHGPHPDYRQEWWYLTGNLDSDAGERFGFELTFFRFALAPAPAHGTGAPQSSGSTASGGQVESGWRTRQMYMAHFAVTDVARQRFRFAEKLSRGALGLAGAAGEPLRVWIDDWRLGSAAQGAVSGEHWRLHAANEQYELDVEATPLMEPVLNGERGFSRKSDEPGSASYYYSIPRVAISGRLVRDGRTQTVHGLAWLDREWGSGALGRREQGWDWFALQLKDGSALMFYSLRNRDGTRDPNSAGTWVSATGESRALSNGDVQIEVGDRWANARGDRYPSRWRVRVPAVGLDVDVRPVLADQELSTSARYWEGAVDVSGAGADGKPVAGRGYVELVGYAGGGG